MRSFVLLLCLVIATALVAFGEPQRYEIQPELSSLTFDASAGIHQVHGVSKEFHGQVNGDPLDITTAVISVRLDPKTFDTDNKSRDKVMREKSLEVEKFSSIEFRSTAVETSEKKLEYGKPLNATVKGVLKLHGVEKELSVPVKIYWDGQVLAAEGDLALLLDEYQIFRPKILFFRLQNNIRIHFRVGARKIEARACGRTPAAGPSGNVIRLSVLRLLQLVSGCGGPANERYSGSMPDSPPAHPRS